MADSLQIKLGITGADKVAAGIEKLVASTGQLKMALLGVGAAVGGAMGLASLGQAAIATARLGGQLSDLSARTGMSTKSLIILRQAFQDAGVGADNVGKSVSLLQKNLFEAATAGGPAAAALADMGLSAADLVQLAPEEQFQNVSAAISGIENPAQRTAAAMAVFGKGAGELLPLFADGGAIDSATASLGKMPDVLSRNVPVLDSISDAFDRLPNKATQLFAGIADQLAPAIASILDFVDKIDLTGIGQKIGAFVNVGIDAFKRGKFGEFITLTIEAGFEAGAEGATKVWEKLKGWMSQGTTWAAIGDALLTSINEAMKGVGALILNLLVPFGAVADWVGDAFNYAFQESVNALTAGLEGVINWFAEKSNAIFGTKLGKVSFARETAFQAPDFTKSWDLNKQGAEAGQEWVNGFFDESTNTFRQMTGRAEGIGIGTSARDRLGGLISDKLAAREAEAAQQGEQKQIQKTVDLFNFKLELQRQELMFAQEMQALANVKGKVESDWLLSNNQKYEKKKRLLQGEIDATNEQIAALTTLQARTSNPEEKQAVEQKLTTLRGQAGNLANQQLGLGPDPNSFSDQWNAAIVGLQNNFLTLAQTAAGAFKDAFNAATTSISSGIQGLIMGTMTWGKALMNIGTSIVQSIVKSFSDMVAQWIMSHVIMQGVASAWSAFQSALRAKDVAQSNAAEAAKMPALAANATWASIGSFGVAAVVGLAAIAGILAATGAFKEGGYTGDGNPDSVAGIVHRGEYVVPADAVDRIGVSTLEAISSGSSPSAAPVMTSASAPSPITLNMGVFDDPRRLSDWARSNEGRTVLVDILRQHSHEFRA